MGSWFNICSGVGVRVGAYEYSLLRFVDVVFNHWGTSSSDDRPLWYCDSELGLTIAL